MDVHTTRATETTRMGYKVPKMARGNRVARRASHWTGKVIRYDAKRTKTGKSIKSKLFGFRDLVFFHPDTLDLPTA